MSQGFTKGVPVDTDVNLAADSNLLIPSQHAVKTYIDNQIGGPKTISLDDLTDVTITSPTINNSLRYNGSQWVNVTSPPSTPGVTSVATSFPLTGGPITTTGIIGISQSSTSTDGYLSSTDYNTFNNKPNRGFVIAMATAL